MGEQVRPYVGTTNGVNTCLVITTSKKRVAKIAHISAYYVNRYWCASSWKYIDEQGMKFEPHTVYIGNHLLGEPPKWEVITAYENPTKTR